MKNEKKKRFVNVKYFVSLHEVICPTIYKMKNTSIET